jgi:uncharacterized protein YcfJ
MLKIIFSTLYFLVATSTISYASQFNNNWGVVISIKPITLTTNITQPHTKHVCENKRVNNNFADIAVGGLIGSVIGNKLSDQHGAGAIGALFGSLLAIDKHKTSQMQTCYDQTYYTNQKITKFSHYRIKVRTENRIINLRSSVPYNIHDVIYFNN